jgi:hypothetical protein
VKLPHQEWTDELRGAQLVGSRWVRRRRPPAALPYLAFGVALAAAAGGLAYGLAALVTHR